MTPSTTGAEETHSRTIFSRSAFWSFLSVVTLRKTKGHKTSMSHFNPVFHIFNTPTSPPFPTQSLH